jgi:hypothetical protein
MKYLFLIFLSYYSFAGSSQAKLECVSNSGKTKITGWVPGDSSSSFIEITINNKKKSIYNGNFKSEFELNNKISIEEKYPDSQLSAIAVVNQVSSGTFAISISESGDDYPYLQIYSIGGTVYLSNKLGSNTSTFKAQIKGDLRELFLFKYKLPDFIDLNCSLEYSL